MERRQPAPGATGSVTHVVAEADLAAALAVAPGEAYPPVLATTRMIALMERAAAEVLLPLLGPGELSVGVVVDIRHTAATPLGATVRAEARFIGISDRLYAFEVVALDPGGEIGRGRHRRAIIDSSRLIAGAERRRGTPQGGSK